MGDEPCFLSYMSYIVWQIFFKLYQSKVGKSTSVENGKKQFLQWFVWKNRMGEFKKTCPGKPIFFFPGQVDETRDDQEAEIICFATFISSRLMWLINQEPMLVFTLATSATVGPVDFSSARISATVFLKVSWYFLWFM